MTKARDELRQQLIDATYAWIRDCGLDVQDVEPFVSRDLMSQIDTYVKGVIGGDEQYIPGNPLLGKLAPRRKELIDADNELRAEQRNRAGLEEEKDNA